MLRRRRCGKGIFPFRGGFRVGLCGTAVMKDGANTNLKDLSSAAVRIGREQRGIADNLAPRLFRDGEFASTLILSPPGRRQDHTAAGPGSAPLGGRRAIWPPARFPH